MVIYSIFIERSIVDYGTIQCQSMEVELELKDESPFFIRPFPIKESDKDIVDKEMRKGCLLGILKKGMSSYSSPIMLIPRKLSGSQELLLI